MSGWRGGGRKKKEGRGEISAVKTRHSNPKRPPTKLSVFCFELGRSESYTRLLDRMLCGLRRKECEEARGREKDSREDSKAPKNGPFVLV